MSSYQVTAKLPPRYITMLRAAARMRQCSMAEIVRQGIETIFQEEKETHEVQPQRAKDGQRVSEAPSTHLPKEDATEEEAILLCGG